MSEQRTKENRLFPIQTHNVGRKPGKVAESVYMAAYEVYSHVYGPQQAMIDLDKGCRGGFGVCELTAFLYARAFPKDQWSGRVDEAFRGMEGLR
jgi:hypothetical protein